jgi:protease I
MATLLFVIAKKDFQDYEYLEARRVVEQSHAIKVASATAGPCQGRFGTTVNAELSCADALKQLESFKAVVVIGGGGALSLLDVPEALDLCRQAGRKQKILAAICVAPVILAKAGVLEGQKATVWDDGNGTQIRQLKQGGATVLPQHVVVDGNIITADGPQAAKEFGRAILKALR